MNSKQPMKRQRILIDGEDIEPRPLRFPNTATMEDLSLPTPQHIQGSISSQN